MSSGTRRNGTWTGLLGNVARAEAEIGFGGISVSPERLSTFGFCSTYYTDAYAFISPLVTAQPNAWAVLFKPLTYDYEVIFGF